MSVLVFWLLFTGRGEAGVLSRADPGVLERVAEVRSSKGWGLDRHTLAGYDVLVATKDCAQLGRPGWLLVRGRAYRVMVVDCAQRRHRMEMERGGLLADVNRSDLVHRVGVLFFGEMNPSCGADQKGMC